jgi:hypothetical protein
MASVVLLRASRTTCGLLPSFTAASCSRFVQAALISRGLKVNQTNGRCEIESNRQMIVVAAVLRGYTMSRRTCLRSITSKEAAQAGHRASQGLPPDGQRLKRG